MILRTRQRKIDFFDFFLILHSPYLPFHVFYTSLYSTTCPIKSTVVFSLSSLFYKTTTFCVSHRYVSRETKYIKSTVTIFKSNARETWHAILVSFADIYPTESLCILAERLSQSEIVLPLRKTCYYSPLAEVGVFSTEINNGK